MSRDWANECGAVIPCLNEAEVIGRLVQAVRLHLPKVLVVDDGSRDHTASIASAAGAEVAQHEATLGKGAALATGLHRLHAAGLDWALLLDGDGQHDPEDIPRFFERQERTQAGLIIGNRMPQADRMPPLRRVVNRWMSRRLSRLAGQPLPDSQCGFRLLRLSTWAGLRLRTTHFEVESELVLAFVQAGERVEFVPIRVIYGTERTKIRPLTDAVRWLQWFFAQK